MRLKGVFTALLAAGSVMATVAAAQEVPDNGQGELSLGASYSTQYGAIAVIGFDGTNIGGSGVDAAITYRYGDTGQGGTARLRFSRDLETQRLGQNASFFFAAQASLADWDTESYKNNSTEIAAGVAADLGSYLSYSTKVFVKSDDLSGVGAGTSPLVAAAFGKSSSAGAEFVAHVGKLQGGVLPTGGTQLDLGVTWAGAGDRKTSALFAGAAMAQPIGANNTAILRFETGAISGLDGQDVGIQDRAFLGGAGGPRGFAFGSIGPRDFVAGSIDSPLGGNRYVSVSAELRRDISDRFSVAAFADAGAVWDLGNTTLIGAGGPIDDSRNMRASSGVAVYWETGLGKLNLSFAQPIQSQKNDDFNEVSLTLLRSF